MIQKIAAGCAAVVIVVFECIGVMLFSSGFAESASPLTPQRYGYAPYAYVAHGNIRMSDYMNQTGTKFFWASFVQSTPDKCMPAWAGEAENSVATSLRSGAIAEDIMQVRLGGGDVGVSVGGAAGTDLAVQCTNLNDLTKAYRTVINQYQLRHINFDIEGQSALNSAANTRRIQALYILQKENPNLKVTLTLEASPYGLSSTTLADVKHYRDAGVTLSGVFVMTAAYGDKVAIVGPAALQTADSLHKQLVALYPSLPDSDIWLGMGMVPEFGLNNGTTNAAFTLADAVMVHDYAVNHGIGTLSGWAANRDKSCRNYAAVLAIDCSGIIQQPNQFQQILTLPDQP